MKGRSWIAWLVVVVGLCWTAFDAGDLLRVARTARWPVTVGTITAAAIHSDTVGVTITRVGFAPVIEGRLHVSYDYVLGAHTYTSARLSILPPSTRDATFRAADDPAEITSRLRAYFAGDFTALDAIAVETGGTPFQREVWTALRTIPAGKTVGYGALAAQLDRPKAVRAVAQACATNHIAVAIPCHRVVRRDGDLADYRWGVDRKRELLRREAKD